MPAAAAPQSRHALLAHGRIDWLECGPSGAPQRDALPPLVLLHGIGSCAASWRELLPLLAAERRVLAWDAPGYAASAPLPMDRPQAADYADAALAWMAAAQVHAPILLGHSLGALMAASVAARSRDPISALLLASPAQGYATAAASVRDAKYGERVNALRQLGIEGLARERSARLCAPGAATAVVARVRDNMQQITERGYAQAAWMLAHDHIDAHLDRARAPLAVLCGEFDVVTPAEPSRLLAERHGAPFRLLAKVGHACYVEDAAAFAAAVQASITTSAAGIRHE
jgi:pimeloyl-ACP methyl ester carboxylesterase